MIGLDTNVLVRYITSDDNQQAALAGRLIESLDEQSPGYITLVTLAELGWVLESAYHQTRADVARAFEQIVRTADFDLEHADHVRKAIERCRSTPADFADALARLMPHCPGPKRWRSELEQAG